MQEMDGLNSAAENREKGLILIGATNRFVAPPPPVPLFLASLFRLTRLPFAGLKISMRLSSDDSLVAY